MDPLDNADKATRDAVLLLSATVGDAETRLLAAWAEAVMEGRPVHAMLTPILRDLIAALPALVRDVITGWVRHSHATAVAEVATTFQPPVNDALLRRLTVDLSRALIAAATGQVTALIAAATRATRTAALQVGTRQALRRHIVATVVDRMVADGVTGVPDSRGRVWRLDTYADMAIRTHVHTAVVETRLDTYRAAGAGLVIVSDSPHECVKCRPFEGRLLSLPGWDGVIPAGFQYAGTVADARTSGLLHPGCRHAFHAYTPGLTRPRNVAALADPEGDRARQRQRALERAVRDAKRREVAAQAAGDPVVRARVTDLRQARQARLRDHLASPEAQAAGLKRRRDRERVSL